MFRGGFSVPHASHSGAAPGPSGWQHGASQPPRAPAESPGAITQPPFDGWSLGGAWPAAAHPSQPEDRAQGSLERGNGKRCCVTCGKLYNVKCDFNCCKKCCQEAGHLCRIHNPVVEGYTGGVSLKKAAEMRAQGLEPTANKRRRKQLTEGAAAAASPDSSWLLGGWHLGDGSQQQQPQQPGSAHGSPSAASRDHQGLQQQQQHGPQRQARRPTAAAASASVRSAGGAEKAAADAAAQWPPPRPQRAPLARDGRECVEGREALSVYLQEVEETRLWRGAMFAQQQQMAAEERDAALERYQRNAALLQELLGGSLLAQVAAATRAGAASGAPVVDAAGAQAGCGAPVGSDGPQLVHRGSSSVPEEATTAAAAAAATAAPGPAGGQPPPHLHPARVSAASGMAAPPPAHPAPAADCSRGPQQPTAAAATDSSTPAAVRLAEVAAHQLLQRLRDADTKLHAAAERFAARHAGVVQPAAPEQSGGSAGGVGAGPRAPAAPPEGAGSGIGAAASGEGAATATASLLLQAAGQRQQHDVPMPPDKAEHKVQQETATPHIAPQGQQRQQQVQQVTLPALPPDAFHDPAAGAGGGCATAAAATDAGGAIDQQQLTEELLLLELPVEEAALRRLVRQVPPEPRWVSYISAAADLEQIKLVLY